MNDVITTRAIERSDVDAVLDLLRAALGEPPLLRRTPELFAWKHFENPFGESIALVAESGDRLVGLRAFMRWQLRTPAGGVVDCVRAVDTATHPEFHRRGIFRRLTEEAIEQARLEGVDLVFNTPNPKSGSGYLKMGWSEVGDIGAILRPTRHILTRSRSEVTGPWIEPGDLETVEDREPLGLRTPRSPEYLEWRFRSHPTARYQAIPGPRSLAVVRPNRRQGREELLVTDLFGDRPHQAIRNAVRSTGAWYLAAWFSAGSPERASTLRAGMIPVPGVSTLTLMARPLSDLDLDISSLHSWDLALSDLELL